MSKLHLKLMQRETSKRLDVDIKHIETKPDNQLDQVRSTLTIFCIILYVSMYHSYTLLFYLGICYLNNVHMYAPNRLMSVF